MDRGRDGDGKREPVCIAIVLTDCCQYTVLSILCVVCIIVNYLSETFK